ncbi:ankyrin repeat domain-containing protein [Wolbachia endosymbiont (group B) of Endotricha flammealis]|uniref:ankyrin repeat domain-containing protein n=1 Tax=Wolbachia endosymbiont (group B) of Endotricha flammealis TaxID=2954005 RepID=UPI00222F2AC1|nr:ankyrin repeat domain-containing protein [Wolbachia endosymbiont (group B) of Endotricha flammealis]
MIGKYKSLKTVLRTIEAKKDLNKDNIIKKIQEELKKQNQDLYQEWEKGNFDVNHVFDMYPYEKWTLLIIAAENGYKKTVGFLIGAKADVNAKDGFDRTALYGFKEVVEVLIGAGADVNVRDKSGYTALHFAAYTEIVEVLLKEGAKVNAVDKDGKTPLDHAKSQDVVKALLDAGGGSFVKARNKAKIAGGVTGLLGTAIAVALFTTGTITAQLTPIVIAVVAVTAAALVVGCATYALLKPSTKVDGAEKPSAVLTTNEQQGAA